MTKFEEEAIKEAEKCGYVMAKSKIVFYEDEKGITFVDFNGTHTNFNFPWLEFAKNWHSDEEFQAEKDARKKEYEIHQDIYSKTSKKLNEAELEIANLKSQLQQQALPVVPSFVADWYEFHMNGTFSAVVTAYAFAGDDKAVVWLGENGGMDLLCKMKLYGYQVEKPQLFYLKHIDFCKTDKHYDWFTIKHSDGPLNHLRVEKGQKPSTIDCKFTQQEIDSMHAGSYEKIEVVK